ncbi:MAG: hemopexin repeat-containing protein [Gaiellaceae bacterium]
MGKFPEPLALPAGVDRIDALLESADGNVYLFNEQCCYVYSGQTYALLAAKPLPALSSRFADLVGVDAAFTDAGGTEWIVGRNGAGVSSAFTREPGSGRWAPREQAWGKVTSTFDDPARIDAAFVDEQGRTYLFAGDQYVRYSTTDYAHVDEGYPRRIGGWWEGEERSAELPAAFRRSLDAAFCGRDGTTYLFAGDRFVAVGDGAVEQPVAATWGVVRNELATTGRVDAAFIDEQGRTNLLAGDQVLRHSDSIENAGVRVDPGYPRRIATGLRGVPGEFESDVDAAFRDSVGTLHLFKDGRTVAVRRDGTAGEAVPTAQRWGVLGPVLPSGTVDAALLGLDGKTYLFSGDQYLRYSRADYAVVDVGYPRTIAGDWGGLRQVDAAFVLDGATHLFGAAGLLLRLPLEQAADLDTGRLPRAARQRLADQGITLPEVAPVSRRGADWQVEADRGIRLTLRRTATAIEVHCDPESDADFHVRYSTRDYATPDAGYPRPLADNWWNLPDELLRPDGGFTQVDAVLTGQDDRTYLFSGDRFVVFDSKRRWWSPPRSLRDDWDSMPFDRVDAAFVGRDEKTYLFSRDRYARYSGGDFTRVDDRYPARIAPFWGNVVNTIARTGRVDAALVVTPTSPASPTSTDPAVPTFTYLFSGSQFVRYSGTDYAVVDDGYPRSLADLAEEPRFAHLGVQLDGVDAAFADRRTVYLVRGRRVHAVSDTGHRRYPDLDLGSVTCAFVEDGAVLAETPDGWRHYSALEGTTVATTPARPRSLRSAPLEFRTGLDAVLRGVDGATYLFKGGTCFNTELNRAYPLAEEWGRPRSVLYQDNAVDAGFVGTDGKTYVFSGDQFMTYAGTDYLDAPTEGDPRPIAEHWGGLRRVALAFVRGGSTYLVEPPGPAGTARCVAYSSSAYAQPDNGYPRMIDADFWAIPERYRPAGFTAPDAVLFEGDSMLLLTGGSCLQHDETADTWSYPRPLERIWPGIGPTDRLTAAFTGRDGATYFFFGGEFSRYRERSFTPREPIRQHWGRPTRNLFTEGGPVDAAYVDQGKVTYLFSGDQYVRYSGADYRYVDAGYPKPIARNLRSEAPFAALPAAVDDELAERAAGGARAWIDAVVGNDRTLYVIAGGVCHAASRALSGTYDVDVLGRIDNTLADRRRVDAAVVTDTHTFLFSGDQYVRYSGTDHTLVDEGYPGRIADSLAAELGLAELPEEFRDGIDAAFRDAAGRTYLFAGRQCLRVEGSTATTTPVAGAWGVVRNEFRAGAPVQAAFVAPTGELYAFARGQYVRYRPGPPDAVDEGHPRSVKDNWGNLPPAFEQGLDGAFVFEGRVYLCLGDEYVRYPGGQFEEIDRTLPQPFRHRWSGSADYRLADVRAITRFAGLSRAHHDGTGGLAAFLLPGPSTVADPYRYLADLFGWDAEEIKWCRRHSRFLSGGPADEDRFELEFLLELVDLFGLTGKLGAGPSRVRAEVWSKLYETGPDPDGAGPMPVDEAAVAAGLDAAGAALLDLLARRTGPAGWPIVSRELHDELNLARRDALVAAVIGQSAGRTPVLRSSRDLFQRFLIDVDMGSRGMTSRVREAIAATQLYVHRYLLDLEAGPDGTGPAAEELRQRVKTWWSWMRSYRVWEANRKVFLYPENYLRPELRGSKTPAFRTLESDLLQSEITPQSVERAYKRYLDEYTEVSRLTIAGGYVYTKDQDPDGPRRLVLFGRTKTDPRRYYYRRAEFASRERMSASWEPWQHVDLQIDADQVRPVHAFGRVFVFWATTETVPAEDDAASTAVVVTTENDTQTVSPRGKTQRVRIYYSFYNLSKEWVPAQTLGTGPKEESVSGVTMLVRPRTKPGTDKMSILVSCSYTVTPPAGAAATQPPAAQPPAVTTAATVAELLAAQWAAIAAALAAAGAQPPPPRRTLLFDLNPELYADDLLDDPAALTPQVMALLADLEADSAAAATADRVASIFVDPVDPVAVVRFDHPTGAEAWPWFSVDLKGGSFLCRPVVPEPEGSPIPLAGNADRLPTWKKVKAAVELPDRTRYFFDDAGRYATAAPGGQPGQPGPIVPRWGRQRTVLPARGDVDAVLTRGEHTFVFSGSQYARFTGPPFLMIDPGYPKNLAGNTEKLPEWSRVDVAFTGRDGVEYFFSSGRHEFVTSGSDADKPLDKPRPEDKHWSWNPAPDKRFGAVRAALVTDTHTFLISGDQYARWSHRDSGRRRTDSYGAPDSGYPRALAGNPDGLPTDLYIDAAHWRENSTCYFENRSRSYREITPDGTVHNRPTSPQTTAVAKDRAVDAAWVGGGRLYLTRGTEYVRYTLGPGWSVPDLIDEGYPKRLPLRVDTAFTRGAGLYLFSDGTYTRVAAGSDPDAIPWLRPVERAWGELPRSAAPPFDAALDSTLGLYLFVGPDYVRYDKTADVPRPYELTGLPFDIVRLTTGAASELNRKLLSGGVPALLDLSAQETDELAVTTDLTSTTAVRVKEAMVDPGRLPVGSHLDFRSANGLYYWEIFFHAPLLIAQALNAAQRFEDAKQWYEYVFDPTNPDSYWRFLPFLTVDLRALAESLDVGVAELRELGLAPAALEKAVSPVLAALRTLAPALAQNRDAVTEAEDAALATLTAAATLRSLEAAMRTVGSRARSGGEREALARVGERIGMVADLEKQFDLLGDQESLLRAYREDPFDPHAIADLRPVAHRRAVVMGYVDNLLDWGDLLFRQYTGETIDEARMLYVLAYDLLGERRERLGTQLRAPAATFAQLDDAPGDLDLVGQLTAGGSMLTGAGAVHASVANEYFRVPDNTAFGEYWDRISDRLRKIRQSLNILGISQPVPLFEPPLDPMALVRAVASGVTPDAAAAGAAVPVPPYRFSFVYRKAQELADKLRQFGSDLLSVLERRDAEELSRLQGRQEGAILAMTRAIKQAQVRAAEESVAELAAAQAAAQQRAGHYERLIAQGLSAVEEAQLGLMATAAAAHFASSVLKVAAGIAYVVPQVKAGPFIIGVETGGRQLGDSLDKAAEVGESFGEGFGVTGEILGVRAEHDRRSQDWELQLRTAQSDILQVGHQLDGARQQLAIAQREADILDQQIRHNEAVAAFLTDKFSNAELYGWMAGQLSGIYFQTYHLAYETAKSAERAFLFESGQPEEEAGYIRPTYWDSRRSGLLAGESLGLDLERLEKAYLDGGARGMEVTKQYSLLASDPMAMLRLRETGSCELSLSEAEFDQDFPGHYRRQIRTVTVTFSDAEGEPLWVNATLTQLGHKTVLTPDPKAVAHLLDPKGLPPETVRTDWRPSQQIALSEVDDGRENNGMFEARFDDDRYLPFEGTGAVSRWRLDRPGRAGEDPYDVVVTIKYTAETGGEAFAGAVKGMLKPYPAARYIDVARDFPEQWEAFLADGEGELALPLTPDMFPGMSSRRIEAVYPAYDRANGGNTRLVLNGTQNLTLADGTVLPTPGLTIGTDPSAPITFRVDGAKEDLLDVGLVLAYQATVS